jgi:hypothetical protein
MIFRWSNYSALESRSASGSLPILPKRKLQLRILQLYRQPPPPESRPEVLPFQFPVPLLRCLAACPFPRTPSPTHSTNKSIRIQSSSVPCQTGCPPLLDAAPLLLLSSSQSLPKRRVNVVGSWKKHILEGLHDRNLSVA